MESKRYELGVCRQYNDPFHVIQNIKPSCKIRSMSVNNSLIKEIYTLKNTFFKQQMYYLTNFKHESSNFYGLPKFKK